MASNLGKRKRVTRERPTEPSVAPSPDQSSHSDDEEPDLQAIFRRAFEAKFAPLAPEEPKKARHQEPELDESKEASESDWSGISSDDEGEDEPRVQVVDYASTTRSTDSRTSKADKRAFMSAKPPTTRTTVTSTTTHKPADEPFDPAEASHLKNDLALQKLLRDSRLLASSSSATSTSSSALSLPGALRHKSTDLHLQTLGAKTSIFTQKNMPMAQRKHMAQKTKTAEERRRTEARENGVVLEKETRAKQSGVAKRRERGVGGPAVGKFSGGMLKLSRRDVAGIIGGSGGRGGKGNSRGGKRR
ncbi:hypothetical protein BDV95DRAFT_631675 [Massariosphaeria phaeospora]|uniref:Uncharacterized protein n=1 Tax=Massariosphaeria phaeospora TaxID=100035 RepID=A0A7C8M3I6_9PLEO|nr:hypothetical protein BDV95DRAFT_631675 [Massariosphaeria phaeospora]